MSQVLLVFTDPALGARLAATLAEAGFGTRVVTSGERAMDRFIQEPSDVIVVDFDLDGRDGITTTEAIRWMPGGRRARVVLTAAKEPDDGPLESLGVSVDAFASLVGPHDPARLLDAVQRAAAVEPNTAETRVLSTELALLEAERRRSRPPSAPERTIVSESVSPPEPATPIDPPVTHPLEDTPTPLTIDLEDSTLDEPTLESWEWRDTDGRIEGKEVRQLAEDEAHTDSALVGTFDKMPFPRLLHRLAERRTTGALICVHPRNPSNETERQTTDGTEPTKVVYFRSGVPVHVRSNVVGECLGQVLTRTRKIGTVALRESLRAMRRGEGRQGEVLLEMGAIGPIELSEALGEQMRLKLYELFAWQRGTFRLTLHREAPPELIDLELGLAEITFRGLSATRDPQEIIERLEPHSERFVVPQARKLVRFLPLSADRSLRSVIRRCDGTRTIKELLEGSSERERAAILIYAMECLDAVRFEADPLRIRVRSKSSLPSVPSAVTTLSTGSIPVPESLSLASPSSVPSEPVFEPVFESWTAPEPPAEATAFAAAAATAADANAEPASVHLSPFSSAITVPEPDPPPRVAELTMLTPASSIESGPPSEPPARDAAGSGLRTKHDGELDERVERLLKAERRFRRGQRALTKSNFASAIDAFAAAVELCPDEAQFAVHLAWARHMGSPDDAPLLEQCIFEAARGCAHSPELVAAHLLRARLLRAAHRPGESAKSYARVLELEPDHGEAARELADLEP